MKILIVGGGPLSGASCMRADQLGAAIGARVHTHPYSDPAWDDVEWADAVVLVKRLKKRFNKWIEKLKATRKPIVWDALDFWKQPDTNPLDGPEMIAYLEKTRAKLGASFVVTATEAMAADGGFGHACLPHHHRIGLVPTEPRARVKVVGYEGSDRYVAAWRPAIEVACKRRGWRFVMNPPKLTDADIVLALRGGEWDGWACRRWKSGVKYANAIAAGRPIVTQPAAAFVELGAPGSVVESGADLDAAFDEWTPLDRRIAAAARAAELTSAYRIDAIAARYTAMLADALLDMTVHP